MPQSMFLSYGAHIYSAHAQEWFQKLKSTYIAAGYLPSTATTTARHMAREWRRQQEALLKEAEMLLSG